MSWSLSRQLGSQLLRETARANSSLPAFLVPAFATNAPRSFSTSAPRESRIGGATLSIPSEVSLKFIDLPRPRGLTRTDDVPTTAVEVTGPLGRFCWIRMGF